VDGGVVYVGEETLEPFCVWWPVRWLWLRFWSLLLLLILTGGRCQSREEEGAKHQRLPYGDHVELGREREEEGRYVGEVPMLVLLLYNAAGVPDGMMEN
jgi:hypothetical protein